MTSWEGRTLKKMSQSFCNSVNDKDAPNPLEQNNENVATDLLSRFENILGK